MIAFPNAFKLQVYSFIAHRSLPTFIRLCQPSQSRCSTGIKSWACVIPAEEDKESATIFSLSVFTSHPFPLPQQIRTLGSCVLWCTEHPAVQVSRNIVNPSTAIMVLASDGGYLSATAARYVPEDKAINLFY